MLAALPDAFVTFFFNDLTPGFFELLSKIVDFLFDVLGNLPDIFRGLGHRTFHLDDFALIFDTAEKSAVALILQILQGVMIAAGHDNVFGL